MSVEVMTWVWNESDSQNAARLVLLAIADCARVDGSHAFPSIAELQKKANVKSVRSVQEAIRSLVNLGELDVKYNQGPNGSNMYRVVMDPAEIAGRRICTPAESAGGNSPKSTQRKPKHPAESAPPQNLHPPADSAPGTVKELTTTDSLRSSGTAKRPAAKRGTRIPDDFALTDDMRQWGNEKFPDLDGEAITEEFIDYWRGVPGIKGEKTDWISTWRNWIRREARNRPKNANGHPATVAPSRNMQILAEARRRLDEQEAEARSKADTQARTIQGEFTWSPATP